MDDAVNAGLAQQQFEDDVAGRFGLLPNFFQTAGEAPGLIAELWSFAKSAYIDNPLPSLFKERLFVHLSRFCQVRYCIIRHVGFLVGEGRPAGDPTAVPQSIDEVAVLLSRPGFPTDAGLDAALSRLEKADLRTMPEPGSEAELDVFDAATILFLEPERGVRSIAALKAAMGGAAAELLMAFLAFVRTAHYWTVTHPELSIEADMTSLLEAHERLADLLINDPEAARGKAAQRLAEEVVLLRSEHDDREALRQAVAQRDEGLRHQQQLINELNHRVKNSLAIVQSMATQTLRRDDIPLAAREAFTARLVAFAQAHDLLTKESWDGAELTSVLGEVSEVFANDQMARIVLNGPPTRLNPGQALALSMAVHELGTNAVKYGALSNDTGHVEVEWAVAREPHGARLKLRWKEVGGPAVEPPAKKGFGTRLIERGLAGDLNGEVTLAFERDGLLCLVDAPMDGAPSH